MTKFSYRRENDPEYIKEKLLENVKEKIKQVLSQEEFKITPLVKEKLTAAVREIKKEIGLEVPEDEILKSALETVYVDCGGWPQDLEKSYINLVAMQIENKIAAGEEFYKAMGEVLTELKRKGIKIDSNLVEKMVREKI